MADLEKLAAEAKHIETEIVAKGKTLGIDWGNESGLRSLAKQALASHDATLPIGFSMSSPEGMAKIELFGLAQMVLKVVQHGEAEECFKLAGPAWSAFAKALWAEHQSK